MVKGPEPSPDPKLKPVKGEGEMSAANRKAKQKSNEADLPELVNI